LKYNRKFVSINLNHILQLISVHSTVTIRDDIIVVYLTVTAKGLMAPLVKQKIYDRLLILFGTFLNMNKTKETKKSKSMQLLLT